MQLIAVDLIRQRATCKDCGHKFATYAFPDFEYGRKEAETQNPSDFAFVDCLSDPVCKEVSSLVKEVLSGLGKKDWQVARCFDQVFGVACDPAPSGHQYDFTGKVWCPVCGSTNTDYGPEVPMQVETVHIPHVTHRAWQQLKEMEKRELIRETLQKVGCLL